MAEYINGHCILYREGQLKALALESLQDRKTRLFILPPDSHLSKAEVVYDKKNKITGIHIEMKPGYEKQIKRYHAFICVGEEGSDRFNDELIMIPIYSSCIKDGVQHYEDSKGCISWITDIYRYNVRNVDNISWR